MKHNKTKIGGLHEKFCNAPILFEATPPRIMRCRLKNFYMTDE